MEFILYSVSAEKAPDKLPGYSHGRRTAHLHPPTVLHSDRHSSGESSPVIVNRILTLQKEMFDQFVDYTDIKKHFNQLMLEQEDWSMLIFLLPLSPIRRALQYVMKGNYIDFGVLSDVNSEKLMELLVASERPDNR